MMRYRCFATGSREQAWSETVLAGIRSDTNYEAVQKQAQTVVAKAIRICCNYRNENLPIQASACCSAFGTRLAIHMAVSYRKQAEGCRPVIHFRLSHRPRGV
jgi:hypothetical protein